MRRSSPGSLELGSFRAFVTAACTFLTVPKWCPFKLDLSRGNKKKSGGTAQVGTVKNVQAAVTNALKEIPVQDFHASYDAWQNRWQRCIDAQGCYFEEY